MIKPANAHSTECREHVGRCLGQYETVYQVFRGERAAGSVRACNLCGLEEFSGDRIGVSILGKLTELNQGVRLVVNPAVEVFYDQLKWLQKHLRKKGHEGLDAVDVDMLKGGPPLNIMLAPLPKPEKPEDSIAAEPQHQGLEHTKISIPRDDLGVTLGAPLPLRQVAGSVWASPMLSRTRRGLGD